MGKRGPKPAPANVVELKTGKELRDPGVLPPDGSAKRPSWVKGAAKAEWDRLAPKLERMGVLASIDANAFGAYCCAVADYVEAREDVEKRGQLVVGQRGEMVRNPSLMVAAKALEQLKTMGARFYLSPADRAESIGRGAAGADSPAAPSVSPTRYLTGG